MKTLFKSQDLWDIVDTGVTSGSGDDAQKKENVKRDAKALFFIQQAMDNSIFLRIAAASTANQAWAILKTGRLHPKFDHVVAAIEESKDLSVFSFDELMGSLQAHEARINRNTNKEEEKAFQIRGEPET
ncbi:hypothetical protein Tco_1243502 [Tanacetum coccineum]